jgi:hypothetical protein
MRTPSTSRVATNKTSTPIHLKHGEGEEEIQKGIVSPNIHSTIFENKLNTCKPEEGAAGSAQPNRDGSSEPQASGHEVEGQGQETVRSSCLPSKLHCLTIDTAERKCFTTALHRLFIFLPSESDDGIAGRSGQSPVEE